MEGIDLSFFFKTKPEANSFTASLAKINDSIYRTDFDLEKVLSENLGFKKKDKFLALLKEKNININQKSELKTFIEKISEDTSKIPVLNIVLAFDPDEKTLEMISEWFLTNIKKQVVFDINVNRKIIAGAQLFYNGKYQDYSIRPKIEEIIKSKTQNMQPSKEEAGHQRTQDVVMAR